MTREPAIEEEKRITLRLALGLWRRLRMEAARRDLSTNAVISVLLDEKLRAIEAVGESGSQYRIPNPER